MSDGGLGGLVRLAPHLAEIISTYSVALAEVKTLGMLAASLFMKAFRGGQETHHPSILETNMVWRTIRTLTGTEDRRSSRAEANERDKKSEFHDDWKVTVNTVAFFYSSFQCIRPALYTRPAKISSSTVDKQSLQPHCKRASQMVTEPANPAFASEILWKTDD